MSHPNVMPLLGISRDFGPLPAMISPWYACGNASHFIETNPNPDRMRIIRGIATGLAYMHSGNRPIIHGDLKAENVLVSDSGEGVIGDFGVTQILQQASDPSGFTTENAMGTFPFMAPELHDNEPAWTPATDVYAFAGTCLQILTGEAPYKGRGKKIHHNSDQ
jgi:serine/threonine protein kinase